MLALIAEHGAEMESDAREQVKMITDALAESARYGKCPADLRGALIKLAEWLRSDKQDFMKWEAATAYGHAEYLVWFSWITQENTRPRPELDGLTALEYLELFVEAGKMSIQEWNAIQKGNHNE